MAIDTLQLSKELQDVAFPRGQADALAQIFLRHTNGELEGRLQGNFARIDKRLDSLEERFGSVEERLGSVEERLGSLEERFGSLEERLGSFEERLGSLEKRLGSLEASQEGIRRELSSLGIELKAEIKAGDATTRLDLIKWIVGSLVMNLIGTAGLIITLIKLVPR